MLALCEGEPEALATARLRETAALRERTLRVGLCESSPERLERAVTLVVPLLKRVTLALDEAVPEALPAPPAVAVTSAPLPPLRVAHSEGTTEDDAEGLPGCSGEVLGCTELLEDTHCLGEGEARRLLLREALRVGWREALGLPLGQRVASELGLTLGEAEATEGVPLREGRGEGEGVSERAGDKEPEALEEGSGGGLGVRLSWGEEVELGD